MRREEPTIDEVYCNICDVLMNWEAEEREWVCPECGNRAFQDHTCGPDELYFEHTPGEYEEYYDPEDMDPDEDGF